MDYETMSRLVKATVSAAAAGCTVAFGGTDLWLKALLAIILLDYATGVMGAFCTGCLDSRVGFKGILKKVMILCVVALAARLDILLGATGALRGLAIGFYLANDALSVLENAVKIGVPVPKALVDKLEQLKETSEKEN